MSDARLRKYLWLTHGHQGLYGDDGEMQCSACPADYKRDDLDSLVAKAFKAMEETNIQKFQALTALDEMELTCEEIKQIVSNFVLPMYKEATEVLKQDLSQSCLIQINNITRAIHEAMKKKRGKI